MSFSGAVKLGDLDDFLGPAQACIKPQIDEAKAKQQNKNGEKSGGKITIQMDFEDDIGHFDQINTTATNTAAITLADCLACSGCVTSAETVLITQQSTAEFLSHLPSLPTKTETPPPTETSTPTPTPIATKTPAPDSTSAAASHDQGQDNKSVVVVSISPQARTALADKLSLHPLEVSKRLTTFLKSIGVDYVVDTTASLDISLMEARAEFVNRMKGGGLLPLMTSECPGWICYAEKTHGDVILPYISKVKSPQQVMGVLVKTYMAERLHHDPANIYHCTVMPCYDKKLEATRSDFEVSPDVREVDCVLSTGELYELIIEKGGLSNVAASHLDMLNSVSDDQSTIVGPLDSGASGGYAENVLRFAAARMYNIDIQTPIQWSVGKNADIHEAVLEVEGVAVLRVARCYGFRNIQNLIRMIKRKKCKYHYVEVMACPNGCLNGGGQIKANGIKAQKALIKRLDTLYHSTLNARFPDASLVVKDVYENLIKGEVGAEQAVASFHTDYKAVEKVELSNPLAIKW